MTPLKCNGSCDEPKNDRNTGNARVETNALNLDENSAMVIENAYDMAGLPDLQGTKSMSNGMGPRQLKVHTDTLQPNPWKPYLTNGGSGQPVLSRPSENGDLSRQEDPHIFVSGSLPDKVKKEEEDSLLDDNPHNCKQRAKTVLSVTARFGTLLIALYFFICSLDLLSSAFTLLGGRSAGAAFQSPLLQNPICGLMIGVICTAVLQSSSTSTSIVITMVAAGLLTVEMAIPIIMGANIGTSVTGIIVSVTQAGDRDTFRRAFSAATVHDMFNWLTVMILLPVEVATGYLYHVSSAIVNSTNLVGGAEEKEFLGVITDPFTELIIQLDKSVLEDIATGDPSAANRSMLKYWCEFESHPVVAASTHDPASSIPPLTTMVGVVPCKYLFHGTDLTEQAVGGILLIMSLFMLIGCLILMVKTLKALLQGHMASVIQKTINADFPGKLAFLTGYVTILVGAVVTVLVQSSSVVSSALTPLAGVGMVSLERVYPMMLGANIGTTSTAILAAFSATGNRIIPSFQIAMCHLFFNLTGIMIWYPVPHMRRIPLRLARFFGKTTATYRWFAFLYLITMFFILPFSVFVLSIPGWWLLAAVALPLILLGITIGVINILQNKKPDWLPKRLQTWDFLPLWLRSLEPMDRYMKKLIGKCNCCGCCSSLMTESEDVEDSSIVTIDSDYKAEMQNVPKVLDSTDINCVKTTSSFPQCLKWKLHTNAGFQVNSPHQAPVIFSESSV